MYANSSPIAVIFRSYKEVSRGQRTRRVKNRKEMLDCMKYTRKFPLKKMVYAMKKGDHATRTKE